MSSSPKDAVRGRGSLKKKKRKNPSSKKSVHHHPQNDSNNMVEIRVCSAPFHEEADPIVCSFPAGLPASLQATTRSSNGNSASEQQQVPRFVWQTTKSLSRQQPSKQDDDGGDNKKRSDKRLIGKDSACLYTAQSSVSDQRSLRTKLCVGLYDKRAGTLTLHPAAANGTVFALQQSVPSYNNIAAAANNLTTTTTTTRSSPSNSRRALYEEFGSAKKQKVLRSQEANRVNVDSVVGAGSAMMDSFLTGESMSESNRRAIEERRRRQTEEAAAAEEGGQAQRPAASLVVSSAIEEATREWRTKFLPKYNEQAKEPHLVYDARDMAGDAAWGQVSRVVDACLRQEDVAAALLLRDCSDHNNNDSHHDLHKSEEWNESVKEIIHSIASGGNRVKQQLKCAVLLNHFMNLYSKLHKKRIIYGPSYDRARFFGAPLEIGHRFLESFTTEVPSSEDAGKTGYIMSRADKDRCSVHMLLLYIMAKGGKSMKAADIRPVALDLKMDIKDANRFLREAGCTLQRKPGTKTAVSALLKTPLTFPPPKRNIARK